MSIKKKWTTPELIVLVKGEVDESCLVTCKMPGWLVAGPGVTNGAYCKDYPNGERCHDYSVS